MTSMASFSFYKRVALWSVFWVLAAANLSLLFKYNIFVGDDGGFGSYLYNYYFTGENTFILCPDWPVHKFVTATLGGAYRWSYGLYLSLLKFSGVDFYWISAFSAGLFIASFAIFVTISTRLENFSVALAGVAIFGTLEPFLVMSHSIRPDSLIFFGLALIYLGLASDQERWWERAVVFGGVFVILNTHLGGYPLLPGLAVGILWYKGWKGLGRFVAAIGIAGFFYLLTNGFLDAGRVADLLENFGAAGSIGDLDRANTLAMAQEYFVNAKFKRHAVEIILVGLYLGAVPFALRLSHRSQGLLIIPVSCAASYVLFASYVNPYYYTFFFFSILVATVHAWSEILAKRWVVAPAMVSLPFLGMYTAIFVLFINSPGWGPITSERDRLLGHIPENAEFAAPYYFVNLSPERTRRFTPITQLDDVRSCRGFRPVQTVDDLDVIFADTQWRSSVDRFLVNFREVDRIWIGRLGAQSLDDNGFIYVFARQ